MKTSETVTHPLIYINIFLCIALSYIGCQTIVRIGKCETNSLYVDFDVDSESVINFELIIFIDYAKGELLAQLCTFLPLLYNDVKSFPYKVTALTKLNTDPNSRTCALQSVICGFSFHSCENYCDGLQNF